MKEKIMLIGVLIEQAAEMLNQVNKKIRCDQNQAALMSLEEALMHLAARKQEKRDRSYD